MATDSPRVVVAGLRGDGGKTITALSVVKALRDRDLSVSTFKKGPDYIDAAWLGRVGGGVCRNLDAYLVEPQDVVRTFVERSVGTDIAVIEGNRGVFDGRDLRGTHSTAELARLLNAPVVLVVDARKVTRTTAALVKGCVDFDPGVRVAGVVLNRVAGRRHETILRESIEEYAGTPVIGAVPDLGGDAVIPGRHLGLVPPSEFDDSGVGATLRRIATYLDVDAFVRIAAAAGPTPYVPRRLRAAAPPRARVGYFRDSVFTFYYPENLEALEESGARLVEVSSLDDSALPDVDALYIGGGFPETHAERLAENQSMMTSVRDAALAGLPVYAECGGLIYLAQALWCGERRYPMAGVFPLELEMSAKPVGHGYTLSRVDRANPFYPVGTTIRGHEFHYSGPRAVASSVDTCMTVMTGTGCGGGRDGLVTANTFASYAHVHAGGVRDWGASIVERAVAYAARRETKRGEITNVERHATWQR